MLRRSFTKNITNKHFELIDEQFDLLAELEKEIKFFKKNYPELSKEERSLLFQSQGQKIERCKELEVAVNEEIKNHK
nr:hypothetical protein [uncultured Pedobacter sp.]